MAKSGRALSRSIGSGGARGAAIDVRGDRRGEVAAGGEAHEADPIARDAEVGRVRPHVAQGPPRVPERHRMAVAGAQAVAQHEGGDPEAVQELGDLRALLLHRQVAVAAARTHHHGRPARVGALRDIRGDLRNVLGRGAERARGGAGPERDRGACGHGPEGYSRPRPKALGIHFLRVRCDRSPQAPARRRPAARRAARASDPRPGRGAALRPGRARPRPRQGRPLGRRQRLRHAGGRARRDAGGRGPAGGARLLAVPEPRQHRRAAPPDPPPPRLPAGAGPAAAARLVRGDLRPADRGRADARPTCATPSARSRSSWC